MKPRSRRLFNFGRNNRLTREIRPGAWLLSGRVLGCWVCVVRATSGCISGTITIRSLTFTLRHVPRAVTKQAEQALARRLA